MIHAPPDKVIDYKLHETYCIAKDADVQILAMRTYRGILYTTIVKAKACGMNGAACHTSAVQHYEPVAFRRQWQ